MVKLVQGGGEKHMNEPKQKKVYWNMQIERAKV